MARLADFDERTFAPHGLPSRSRVAAGSIRSCRGGTFNEVPRGRTVSHPPGTLHAECQWPCGCLRTPLKARTTGPRRRSAPCPRADAGPRSEAVPASSMADPGVSERWTDVAGTGRDRPSAGVSVCGPLGSCDACLPVTHRAYCISRVTVPAHLWGARVRPQNVGSGPGFFMDLTARGVRPGHREADLRLRHGKE